jgi:hypothetical protein
LHFLKYNRPRVLDEHPTEVIMNYFNLKKWVLNRIEVKGLKVTIIPLLFYLMVSMRKHSLQGAEKFSGINRSSFSRLLKNHSELAVYNLGNLSKRQAKQFSKVLKYLGKKGSLPWKVALLIDSTIQHRSSLHTKNSQRFNHGKGFVIGHQWTNIVLVFNDMLIPLAPIPFYSKKYCREEKLAYKTEHESVIEYITNLKLEDYIGKHNPKEVIVLADSGYDDNEIEKVIAKKKWKYIIALKKTRGVKSEKQYSNTPKSKEWSQVAVFFKNQRWVKWVTIRIFTDSPKRKRMEFRIRHITGYLRNVGRVQLICSQFKIRPKGRKKYLACNDLKATARQILLGYRIRWKIEIFHKEVKMFLGFEDVATKHFESVISHVHWVYCAYILLYSHPPGLPEHIKSMPDKQQRIKEIIDSKEIARELQMLTQIKGAERRKNELRKALQAICEPENPTN